MRVIRDLAGTKPGARGVILTIGSFDGIHLGHQYVIGQTVRRAKMLGLESAVLTFDPHPREILFPEASVPCLTTFEERVHLMASLNVETLIVLPFTKIMAGMMAREFIEDLRRHINLAELWVGDGFVLGKDREGTVAYLRQLGEEMGFSVYSCTPYRINDEVVSSTRIRQHLAEGQIEEATSLLGRYPSLMGRVVSGARRGRQLGFPTANLHLEGCFAVPPNGVYATLVSRLKNNGKLHPSVTNIGNRPTFDNGLRTVEIHLLDFEDDLYGEELRLLLVTRLRGEKRFPNLEAFKEQLARDIQKAREILGVDELATRR